MANERFSEIDEERLMRMVASAKQMQAKILERHPLLEAEALTILGLCCAVALQSSQLPPATSLNSFWEKR